MRMNNKTVWTVVVIIIILIIGYMVWTGTGNTMPPGTATTTTQGVPATGTQGTTNAGTGAPAGSAAGTGAVGTTGQPPRAPTYTDTVTITGFTSVTATEFPLVNYKAVSQTEGQGFFSLVGQNTNEVVWGKNQNLSGNYTLDANQITVQGNPPSHKLSEGEYFIRVQNSSGVIVGESRPFRLAPGQVTGN